MGSARRLFFVAGGGTAFPGSTFTVSGPYGQEYDAAETVLTQLHCHTTGSDGQRTPAQAVAEYASRGYGALAITDHNVVTSQPTGLSTQIVGNELGIGTNMVHIIGLNPGSYALPPGETDPQDIINGIRAAGGEAHVAHPNWIGTTLSASTIAGLTNFYGMEIHNSKVMDGVSPNNPVTYPAFAVSKWDTVLATKRDTYAISVDDYHANSVFETYDVGRVQVFVPSNSSANIVTALLAGQYCADVSNFGVTPGFPIRGNQGIAVTCPGAVRIEAYGSGGTLLAQETGESIAYTYAGSESYVRLVAVGDYTETFSATPPHYWFAFDGSWSVSGGLLSLSSTATARHYMLRRHREGDFDAQYDVKLEDGGGSESASLLFNVLSGSYFYGVRIGESSSGDFNNKLAVFNTTDGGTTTPLIGTAASFTAAMETWYTVKMTYTASSGRIRAKVWQRGTSEPDWMVDVTDTDWTWGGFGIRANFTPDFDNLYVAGFRTYYQPVRID